MIYDQLKELAEKALGQEITAICYLSQDELNDVGWGIHHKVICLRLSSDYHIYAACDEEMNGPGALIID